MNASSSIEQNIIGLSLSIILAASIALALQSLATYIPEQNTIEWAFISLLLIGVTLGIINFILGGKIDKTDKSFSFKIALIVLFSMSAFAFSRFAYFASEKSLSITYIGNFYAILLFPGLMGVSFIIQSWYLRKQNPKEDKYSLWVWGIIILIIVAIFYLNNTFMKIGVTS
jgi:hypothetical protein